MTGAATTESASLPRRNADALGEILWLFAHSSLHRGWRLQDLELFVFPALEVNTYRIYKREGRPIGYISYALLSKAAEDRWLAGGYLLQPEDWVSGDRLWVMDVVAPFGDMDAVTRKLGTEPELVGKLARALRPNKGGKGQRIVTYGVPLVRQQAEWTSGLVNQPERATSRWRRARAAAGGQTASEAATSLPHVRDLIWTTPDRWLWRCCTRYNYKEFD